MRILESIFFFSKSGHKPHFCSKCDNKLTNDVTANQYQEPRENLSLVFLAQIRHNQFLIAVLTTCKYPQSMF